MAQKINIYHAGATRRPAAPAIVVAKLLEATPACVGRRASRRRRSADAVRCRHPLPVGKVLPEGSRPSAGARSNTLFSAQMRDQIPCSFDVAEK